MLATVGVRLGWYWSVDSHVIPHVRTSEAGAQRVWDGTILLTRVLTRASIVCLPLRSDVNVIFENLNTPPPVPNSPYGPTITMPDHCVLHESSHQVQRWRGPLNIQLKKKNAHCSSFRNFQKLNVLCLLKLWHRVDSFVCLFYAGPYNCLRFSDSSSTDEFDSSNILARIRPGQGIPFSFGKD